jgi:hypothetical protein
MERGGAAVAVVFIGILKILDLNFEGKIPRIHYAI